MTDAIAPASSTASAAPTDFNDLAKVHGESAVREQIEAAAKPTQKRDATTQFSVNARGVFFHASDREGNELPPEWLCTPLHILALTRDRHNEEWGRLLAWKDPDGNQHRRAFPANILIGDGRDLARDLSSGGLQIKPGTGALQRLLAYVLTQRTNQRARCVGVPGWHEGQYVLPTGEAIAAADGAAKLVYQHTGGLALAYDVAGDWQREVAPLCVDNSRLIMAVCVMLAGPMLRLAGIGGGGFNFVGDSSTGKSTLLRVAASVAGSPELVREWRATTNGLEGIAALHNDATVILDELAQINPQEIGEAAYMLANGAGKSRSNRSGDARAALQWLTLILSAGEVGLVQHMATTGKRARAGQALRLADVEADAGKGLGVFDALPGTGNAAAFSALLKERAASNYGGIWRPWLEFLATQEPGLVRKRIKRDAAQLKKRLPDNADGQVHRVLDRFALLATAGELATEAGLTGWPTGHVIGAISECVKAFLRNRGGLGNAESQALLSQVRAFLETHGESRFEPLRLQDRDQTARAVVNRAGYLRFNHLHQREYLVLPETFSRELCAGYDPRSAIKWLLAAEWLVRSSDNRSAQKPRIPGIGTARVYVLSAAAIHGDSNTP